MTSALNLAISASGEVIGLAKGAYIFRSSLGLLARQLESFVSALQAIQTPLTDAQNRVLRRVVEMLGRLGGVLSHLSESKWIQPAINWPVGTVHRDIDAFRNAVKKLLFDQLQGTFDIDDAVDKANKRADFVGLKAALQSLVAQVNTSDAVGVQQQIETKLMEIAKVLPHSESVRKDGPSSYPTTLMKKRVEELLEQFKSINIENDDLKIIAQVGAGGFGAVWRAVRLSTAEVVAVKELREDRLTRVSWASLYSEVETMANARHPYVLELVGAHIKEPFRIITSFRTGKSLFDRIHRICPGYRILDATRLTILAFQVAEGMKFLHSRGIVHRDLKTLNILLDDFDDGCVADFGLSGVMKNNQDLVGGVGTPHYTAPEILQHSRYNEKVDVYSYAFVLWEMLTRKVPYAEMTNLAIYDHIINRNWRLPIPQETPEGLRKLITRCWSRNPADRPCFAEIVQQFENHEIAFPGSEPIDWASVKAIKRCPPLDFDYAFQVLQNPNDPHFASVCYFIGSRIDDRTREILRKRNIMDNLLEAKENINGVLILASAILDESEIQAFLEKGGLVLFKTAIESGKGQYISAALRLAMVVPKELLHLFVDSLPLLSTYLESHSASTNCHIIQFFSRFQQETILEYQIPLAKAIIGVAPSIDDQTTFTVVAELFSMVSEQFSTEELQSFRKLLTYDFVVPASFVSALLQTQDSESHAYIVLNAFRAASKSDLNQVLIDFLLNCTKTESGSKLFEQIWKMEDFVSISTSALETSATMAMLFLLFGVAKSPGATEFLQCSPLLQSLIQMKGFFIQRLQIFTVLCMNEPFCRLTTSMDGIVHLLIYAFSQDEFEAAATCLIGALAQHRTGCQILTDNGILDVFAQRFLSSSSSYNPVVHAILRNVSGNGIEIPQGSLIISCLMQDLVARPSNRTEILATITKLAEIMPGSVQEYDLQRIVMDYMGRETPAFVKVGLSLLSVVDPTVFRTMYQQVFSLICRLLNTPRFLNPDIIDRALDVVVIIAQQYETKELLMETDFIRFLDELIVLLPEESSYRDNFLSTRNILSRYVE